MPQDGCGCKISSSICLSRCNWDQSFLDLNPIFNRYIVKLGTDILAMDSQDHSYQNVDSGTDDQPEPLRIPLGSEWDPVKIPKDLIINSQLQSECKEGITSNQTSTEDSNANQSDLSDEDSSKARNSLSTVVRRACTRSPRGSAVNSPSRSPTNTFRSSRPIVIDPSTLESLAAVASSERLQGLPRDVESSLSGLGQPPVYENINTGDCLTDKSLRRKSSQHSNPCIEVTLSDTDSVFSSRSGISSDRVYPRGEFLASYEDSGLSSSGSELVSCRRSSSSAFLGEQSHDVISELGSFSDISSMDSRFRENTCHESLSLEVNRRRLSNLEQMIKSNALESSDLCEEDGACRSLSNLELCRERLLSCTFYLGKMSADEARHVLVNHPVGTFLLRDSSDERFLYSLSVQTFFGPTSIRIGYLDERFYLDSEPDQMATVPKFDCALALIQFYVRQHASSTSFINNKSANLVKRRDSIVILVKAYEPKPPSLLHLTRRTIHRQLQGRNPNRLCLMPSLKTFLNNYPYDL